MSDADVRVNLAPLSAGHPFGPWEAHVSGRQEGQRSGWRVGASLAAVLDEAPIAWPP